MKNIEYINAGAGSGKTYYLTNTFADHVSSGDCTPSQVIMTTFSEKAAADIRKNARIRFLDRGMYGAAAELDAADIGTVHAVAYKYIRKYWYCLGISAQCEVMTDDNKEAYRALTLGKTATADDIVAFRDYVEHFDMKAMMSSRLDYGFWKEAVSKVIEKADAMGIADLAESRARSLDLVDTCFGGPKPGDPDYVITKDITERIFRIAQDWRSEFALYKKDNSIIDYNDMEECFLRLLREPRFKEAQDEISESVRYVFVDEFQDSNPKQLEIFDRLSDLVTKSYWVGDPKQAIYGFRACDTDLVQALADRIRSQEAAGVPGFSTGTLDISRRSLAPLVDFTNQAFTQIFPKMKRKDVVLRADHRIAESLPGVPNIQHWDAEMTLNAKGSPKAPNKEETLASLSSEIRRILDGMSSIKQVFDKEGSRPLRDIQASDIAVLCRTNSDVEAVTASLREYGIPVAVAGSADANRLEIRLVLLLLNYMLGNEPLLTAELAHLCCGLSLSDILGQDLKDTEKLISFLEEYRDSLSDRGVASIVRGLILRMDLLDRCAKWGDAEQRRFNLMALMQAAQDYEASCLTIGTSATLEGFISQVEGDAMPVDGYATGGVSVMTYHGSKGLQWPLVIMYSLSNDLLNACHTGKGFLWDVNAVRKGIPTAADLYPGYYLTYTPKRTNVYRTSIPGGFNDEICKTTGLGSYGSYVNACIEEGRRLLYVGVTRARDILVECGPKTKELTFLKSTLEGVFTGKWNAKTDKTWPSNTMQEIWGPGTPKIFYREIGADTPPTITVPATYDCLPKAAPCGVEEAKRLSPSGITDDKLVEGTKAVCLNDDGTPFLQTIRKEGSAADNEVGTCIHNIFAIYDPAIDRQDMIAKASDIIARHGLGTVLRDPEAVIASAEELWAFLARTYGQAVKVDHELPFREIVGGQMISGSIDMVWYTSDRDCVLVDFKNLAGATETVLDPSGASYIGHYAPQQKAYRDALTRAGLNVRACLLHLAMQGRVIELR